MVVVVVGMEVVVVVKVAAVVAKEIAASSKTDASNAPIWLP